MACYRVYRVDADYHIADAKISNVQMTMRARAKALQLKGDYPVVEVWEGARLVARIATGGAG